MDDIVTVHSLYTETTLPDTTPVNPSMIYDGASVSQIDVPAGSKFVITDFIFSLGFVYWTVEVDFGLGGGFVPLATFGFTLLTPITSEKKQFRSPIEVQGGTGVAVRLMAMLATTPSAPVDVSATLRCYTEEAAAGPTPSSVPTSRTSTVITLSDLSTTGSVEEILNMSENAGAGALALPVPANTFLLITDFDVAAGGNTGIFKLQQTDDGVNWYTIGAIEVCGFGVGTSMMFTPRTAWKIIGGANVAARLAITTPTGALPVASVLSGYRLS